MTNSNTPNSLYDTVNDAVRVDCFHEVDDIVSVALRSFFRILGTPYLFDERILPTMKVHDSKIFAAVRDRPWPPWGQGSRRISAMVQAFPLGQNSYGLSPLYVRPEEVSNIGMRAALYKEVLEHLCHSSKAEINYLVIEGSVLTDRFLCSARFSRTEDIVLTEEARYFFYRADAHELLKNLLLDRTSIPELLSHKVHEDVLSRNALFQAVLEWGRFREIIPIDAGSFEASLPGGVPPSPPSRGPEIDFGQIDEVIRG